LFALTEEIPEGEADERNAADNDPNSVAFIATLGTPLIRWR
jgi:hypothetical protein